MVIKFFATFRNVTQEKETVVAEAQDLRQLFQLLCQRYGSKFSDKIFLSNGQLHPDVIVLVNGRAIEHLQRLDTRLTPSDVISIFPRMAGG